MARKKQRPNRRIVPFLSYNVSSFKEYELIADSPETKKVVFNNLIDAIYNSMSYNKTTADIFLVDEENYVSLEREQWKDSLANAISFFSSEEVEDYESCHKCQQILKNLENE